MFQRKFKAMGMVLLLSLTLSGTAYAAVNDVQWAMDSIYMPASTYINKASSTLAISQGTATIKGYVQRTQSADTIQLTTTLESYSNGSWSAVKSWSVYTTDLSASVNETYQVSRGTYRVCSTFTVSGSLGEEQGVTYSSTVTY
jgi:predicted HNH restriction endonuclease